MSNHQPNVWQTAGRGGRHSHSASRTPQNRSGTASPAQSQAPTQPPKDTNPPAAPRTQPAPHPPVPAAPNSSTTNVWAQRATAGPGGSNGQQPQQPQAAAAAAAARNPSSSTPNPTSSPAFASLEDSGPSTHGFNAAETKAFLAREPAPTAYKLSEDSAVGGATAGAAAAGAVGGNNRSGGGGAGGGGPWGVKANHTANNQPFFVQLAKQIAAFEGGG